MSDLMDIQPLVFIKDLGMRYANQNSKKKYRYGLFICGCGKEFETTMLSVRRGHAKSCGCYKLRLFKKNTRKHGEAGKTRLYFIWAAMILRCNNSNSPVYKYYGGRGITVCDEWKDDYLSFKNWAIQNGYNDELTINRINNDLGYFPSNCNWATQSEQAQNTRRLFSTNKSGYRGVYLDKNKWHAKISSMGKSYDLGCFINKDDAAAAYNSFIIQNNTKHPLNPIPSCLT